VHRIVTTLNLQLTLRRQGVLVPRTTDNSEAYDDLLRGLHYFLTLTPDGNAKAREMFEKAIALDPHYAAAYDLLGENYLCADVFLLSPDTNNLELAFKMGQQAIALDDSDPAAHNLLAGVYTRTGQYDQAASELRRSIALDPNFAGAYDLLARVMNDTGRPAEALVTAEKAIRLNPLFAPFLEQLGTAYTRLGRYEEAIPVLKRGLASSDLLWEHVDLVQDYTELGQEDAARAEVTEVQRHSALDPNSPLGYFALALVLDSMGESAQALVAVQKAMSLDPTHRDYYLSAEGLAYVELGRYPDALAAYKRHAALYPGIFGTTLASLASTLNSAATMKHARRRQRFCDLTRSSV
jgi:tetratricopeptide (TPR) repeat protein